MELPSNPPPTQYPQSHGTHHPPAQGGYNPPSQDRQQPSSNTVVVTTQPMSAVPTAVPPQQGSNALAIVAVVLSSLAIFCCLWYYVTLFCIFPSFVLSLMALGAQGKHQKSMAAVSIGCSLATFVIMGSLIFIIALSVPLGIRGY